MAKKASLPWDCILSAELFRKYKPDPGTYLGVASVFDLAPEEVMLVASHQNDLAAARACGLNTAYIERPMEYGATRIKDVPRIARIRFMQKISWRLQICSNASGAGDQAGTNHIPVQNNQNLLILGYAI